MAIRERIKRLEARTPPSFRVGPRLPGPTTLEEIRSLEADIARLEAGMNPEELREARATSSALQERLEGLELHEEIAAVEREIEELEADEQTRILQKGSL